jgi:uncharacterized membrane protein YraQ (UPF0718 family)
LLAQSAPWFLGGLLLAGLIWHFVRRDYISRLLAGNGWRAVFRATLVGMPLPLCSCSVLPVAQQLRKSGASQAGTAAFLVSTPETGVDSIALTWSLTDPLLTVARPVTAFLTALAVGGGEVIGAKGEEVLPDQTPDETSCDDNCARGADTAASKQNPTLVSSFRYAFGDLLDDLSPYLLIGFVLAGVVAVVLGDSLLGLPETLRRGWGGYIGALVVGLPLYICASSSTPLAAVLLANGFSPGMILVFLLVGPATNLSAVVVIKKILGIPGLIRYLLIIAVVSIIAGVAVDALYDALNYAPAYTAGKTEHGLHWINSVSGAVLGVLILYYAARKALSRLRSFFLSRESDRH